MVKVHIDRDVAGYRPEKGQVDRDGEEVEDRIYNAKDFDRTLVLDDRTQLVARKITEFLKETGDRFAKTIVFCVEQEHAGRMRQALVNENADLVAVNHRYVMRITGNDKEGQDQLDNFVDPESRYPVIVTTSRLLSTGVDAQTCRLIVLDREVGSMTEFKQILGRGTRVHEDTGKLYFTLIDFRGATNHFADPDFDGDPVQIYQPGPDEPMAPPDGGDDTLIDPDGFGRGNVSQSVEEYEVVNGAVVTYGGHVYPGLHQLAGVGFDPRSPATSIEMEGRALLLVDCLLRLHGSSRPRGALPRGGLSQRQLRRAREFISEHFAEDISLQDLAELTGLTSKHFSRAFTQSTGLPPHQYLIGRRIEAAKRLLLDSTISLADTALACGFADQSHFTAAFRKALGVPPGAWRRGQAT